MPRVVVINPNSTDRLTDQIRAAVGSIHGAEFEVVTSDEGPPAIESDDDVISSIAPMLALASSMPADAYVVACFSDPGIVELRRMGVAAFGIAESAMREAIDHDAKVGVISSVDASIPRHERYWRRLGLERHVVGDVAVGLGVLELDTPDAYERVRDAGNRWLAIGATALILGCTGMTHMVERLTDELGVPVIDPCQAGAAAAASSVNA